MNQTYLSLGLLLFLLSNEMVGGEESWLVGRRGTGVAISEGKQKTIEVVRLKESFLVYGDPEKPNSPNVRVGVDQRTFDELRIGTLTC